MASFLKNRKQYVKIQGFQSEILQLDNCSVLQGTKKSGMLYNLFNLEIVLLPRIMKNPNLFLQITGQRLQT